MFLALSLHAGGERFNQVAWIEIPAPMSAAKSVGKFTEQVRPGSSALVAASVVALSFQFPQLNIVDGVGAAVYCDNEHLEDIPFQLAFVAQPSHNGKKQFHIKFKKHSLAVKLIDGKAIVSESEALLKAINAPPQATNSNAILSAKFQPAKLDKLYPGGLLAAIKSTDALPKTGKANDTRLASLAAILKQCAEIALDLNADAEQAAISISATPVPKSPLAAAIASMKGDIPRNELEELGQTLSGNKNFSIKNGLEDTAATVFKGSLSQQTLESIASLLDIKASSDGKNLHVTLTTTPAAVKQLVDTVAPEKRPKTNHR